MLHFPLIHIYALKPPFLRQFSTLLAKHLDERQLLPALRIPLKAGWMSLPRVQVLWAGQDAISSTTRNVFVSPGAVAVHRTAA